MRRDFITLFGGTTAWPLAARFWGQEKTDNWSGVSIKRPDWTMVGTIRIDKGGQWIEYIEKLFSAGKLQTTIVSACRPIPGSKGPSSSF